MNKYQKAYKRLSSDIEVLGELVKKETPRRPVMHKKPFTSEEKIDDPATVPEYICTCPICGEKLAIVYIFNGKMVRFEKSEYCSNCGQKIRWKE